MHRVFGVLDLDYEHGDVRFSIGIRNANDRSTRFALTIGYRVAVCDNMMFKGDFTPVFHKHTSRLELTDLLSVGVDKMQQNFEPLKHQIDNWKTGTLIDDQAKVIIYEAFVGQRFPTRLLPRSINTISSRRIKRSLPARYGVCRMHSRRHSRSSRPSASFN